MAKARAIVQVGDKHFEMQQFDVPRIGSDDALMRVEACGICGSDVDQYDGKLNGLLSFPMIPGHEPVGIIEEIGAEAARRWGLKAGDRVAVEPTRGCGHCRACKRGDSRNCRASRPGAKISVCGFIPTTIAPALGLYTKHRRLRSETEANDRYGLKLSRGRDSGPVLRASRNAVLTQDQPPCSSNTKLCTKSAQRDRPVEAAEMTRDLTRSHLRKKFSKLVQHWLCFGSA